MWKNRYKVFMAVFCIIFVISLVTLAFATVNYLEFYVALHSLFLRVDSFECRILEGGDAVCVFGNFSLVHNSSYSGLVLESVYVSMFVEGDVEPFFERRFWLDGAVLAPFSSIPLSVENQTLTDNVESFIRLKEQGESVNLTVSSCVFVYIFGGPFATKVDLEDFSLTL
ncbi:MAG: hypothetical protein QXR76_05695 [Candidatus Bathyarchaeia archaeon]